MGFKKVGDDLFSLIKSLKQSEKRYFKILASQHVKGAKNSYVKLFDEIDRQTDYDERKLRGNLGDISVAQLSASKHYLQGLIMKSQRNYYSESSDTCKIRDLITDTEILFQKSLFRNAYKALVKADELALRFERFAMLTEVYRWQRKLLSIDVSLALPFNEDDLLTREFHAIEQLSNINQIRALYLKADKLRKKTNAFVRSESELNEFREICNNPLLGSEDNALSFEAKCLYWSTISICALAEGNKDKAYEGELKFIGLFDERPHHLVNHFSNYIVALNNVAYTCYLKKEYDEALRYAFLLRSLPQKHADLVNDKLKARIFSFSSIIELNVRIDTGSFFKAAEIAGYINEELSRLDALIDLEHKLVIYYNLGYLSFGQGNFKAAVAYLNRLLRNSPADYRHELGGFGRILLLLSHFELGNEDLLDHLVKSTYRFLYTRKRLHGFENYLLNILKKLPVSSDERAMKEFYVRVREQLTEIFNDPVERSALYYLISLHGLTAKYMRSPMKFPS